MSIVNLFKKLRDESGVSVLYIAHDLATAYYVSDRIAIMFRGNIVEMGPVEDVLMNPKHSYKAPSRISPRGGPHQALVRKDLALRAGTRGILENGLQIRRKMSWRNGYMQERRAQGRLCWQRVRQVSQVHRKFHTFLAVTNSDQHAAGGE